MKLGFEARSQSEWLRIKFTFSILSQVQFYLKQLYNCFLLGRKGGMNHPNLINDLTMKLNLNHFMLFFFPVNFREKNC